MIRTLRHNKSSGTDGFPAEYYKRFAHLLTPHLMKIFNDVPTSGVVPPTWNDAVVVVIPKKERDVLDVQSYRPNSLLNQDYKLFMVLLTRRLNPLIGCYVYTNQTGFILNRDITDNIYKTLNLIQHCKSRGIGPSLLLSLDIEKAFDQVEMTYLLLLLEHLGVGLVFRRAVQAIYARPSVAVYLNGHTSSPFKTGVSVVPAAFRPCDGTSGRGFAK